MQVQYVDESGFSIIQCPHCNHGTYAPRPVREELLRLAFCAECKKDQEGNVSTFDLEAFLKPES